jgi:hypothetical protein
MSKFGREISRRFTTQIVRRTATLTRTVLPKLSVNNGEFDNAAGSPVSTIEDAGASRLDADTLPW